MNSEEEIVVFKKFDNAIEANIVKTKLDSHDIPCFLTEENLANLYPGQNFMMFSVRLHIFAKDEELAWSILRDGSMMLNDDITRCPQCSSEKLERDFPKKLTENFSSSLRTSLFGIFFPQEKVYHCTDCKHEFDTP